MKKLTSLTAAGLVMGFATIALGAASPDVLVFAKVAPEISITADNTLIDLGTTSTGAISATLGFHVATNTEAVDISAAASPLFKGGVVTSQYKLGLNMQAGVPIVVDGANPLGFGTNVATYTGTPVTIAGFPGLGTNAITFESGLNNLFDHNVAATFSWIKEGTAALPMGEYSGAVKLFAVANPAAMLP